MSPLLNLKNEIANDPVGLGYAGKTADQIAALMNALNGQGPVNRLTLQATVMQMSVWANIRGAQATAGTPAQVLGLCQCCVDLLLNSEIAYPDTSLASFQAALAGLVSASLMTSDEQSTINSLSSRAAVVGYLGGVDATTVWNAINWEGE